METFKLPLRSLPNVKHFKADEDWWPGVLPATPVLSVLEPPKYECRIEGEAVGSEVEQL